jgi:hypothetical protein
MEMGRKAGMKRCRVSYGSGVSETIEKMRPDYYSRQHSRVKEHDSVIDKKGADR